jgi:hypothetical protein
LLCAKRIMALAYAYDPDECTAPMPTVGCRAPKFAYDSPWGQFLQTDPVGYDVNLNLYLYSANDSLNRFDPTGFRDCETQGASTCYVIGNSGSPIQQQSGDANSPASEGGAAPTSPTTAIVPPPSTEFRSSRGALNYLDQQQGPNAQTDGNERSALVFGQRNRWLVGDIGVGEPGRSQAPTTRFGAPIGLGAGDRFINWHSHPLEASGLFSQGDYMLGLSYAARHGDTFLGMYVSDVSGLYGPPLTYFDSQPGVRDGREVVEPRYQGSRIE